MRVGKRWAKSQTSKPTDVVGVHLENVTGRDIKIGPITVLHNVGGWDAAQHQRYRGILARKVHDFWVKGVLEDSLYENVLISLGVETKADAVAPRPWETVVRLAQQADRRLSSKETMADVFEAMDGAMLILGEPGAGKTTMLLDLVSRLLENREEGSPEPIPVVFNLSSWAVEQAALDVWLVEELVQKYGVSRKLAQVMVDGEEIGLFLDGLDEVSEAARAGCVAAINGYRAEHGWVPVCVCCRRAEYEALDQRLALGGAVLLSPLTRSQVAEYLAKLGTGVDGLAQALTEREELWELAESPLMLNLMALTFQGVSGAEVGERLAGGELTEQLFEAYVEQMFDRRARVGQVEKVKYTRAQTVHWLGWLAYQMRLRDQTTFLIERLQPDWYGGARWHYRLSVGVLFGMAGGIVVGLVFGQGGRLNLGLPIGLGVGLITGFYIGLISPFNSAIHPKEVLVYKWKDAIKAGLGGGLGVLLILALAIGLIARLSAGQILELLGAGLLTILVFGLSVELFNGLEGAKLLAQTSQPNEGVRASARTGLIGGLSTYLFCVLSLAQTQGLSVGLSVGPIMGLGGAIYGGWGAIIQHMALRSLLIRSGAMPMNYARFLDYATERIFLRKVGGGYLFVHGLLRDYFADRYAETLQRNEP